MSSSLDSRPGRHRRQGFEYQVYPVRRGELTVLPGTSIEVLLSGAGWGPSVVVWDVEYMQCTVYADTPPQPSTYTRIRVGGLAVDRFDPPGEPFNDTRATRWRVLSVRQGSSDYPIHRHRP